MGTLPAGSGDLSTRDRRDAVAIQLRRQGGAWKVTDTLFRGEWSCRGVEIPTPGWDEAT